MKIPPVRRKLHSDTLIGLSVADAQRRKAVLEGKPLPPLRSSVPTLVGGLDTIGWDSFSTPPPSEPVLWPPMWQSTPGTDPDETPDEWCTSLRGSAPAQVSVPVSAPVCAPAIPEAPPVLPPPMPGTRTPSTDAVFVATLPPPSGAPSRVPMAALLVAACMAVAGTAVAAVIHRAEEQPVWRLVQGLLPRMTSEAPATEPAPSPKSEEPAFATIVVDTGPRGCELWVDGAGRKVRGRTSIRVPAGPHSLACLRNGRLDGRRVVALPDKPGFVRF